MALTQRQKQVLDFLTGFVETNGYNPSYEEIAGALDLASLATVHKHISALATKGYVKRIHNQSRSLEVSSKYLQEYRRRKEGSAPSLEAAIRLASGGPLDAVRTDGDGTMPAGVSADPLKWILTKS